MRSIIIDDEPLAHKVIQSYVAKLDFIEVVASFKSAVEALPYLNQQSVDLMFLDINMPVLQGLDFLRTLSHPPQVIVTTAYQEYALEGHELQVLDYLLKPFAFDRFLKAVSRALPSPQPTERATPATTSALAPGRIFVKSDKKTHQLKVADILFLEGAGSYVKIHLPDRMLMVLERLAHFEQTLPEDQFMRVHRSFIVGLHHVQTLEGNQLFLPGHTLPIGQLYAAQVRAHFSGE
ncbi:MAG TPA: DNA-binding response regulator [Cytophagales bacterium]|nr:DNA-binding response regulator [Cytophagales bacterium]HAA19766.1 DNA-binding response regulator [Cytophagales bacterium]